MANLYLLPDLPPPGAATLTGDVAHHLTRVLRVRVGDALRLGDGRGRTAEAAVTGVQRGEVVVSVEAPALHEPPQPAVTLAFACPRPARADWLFEHGTEVGVAAFQPLWTRRSRPQKLRLERWTKIVRAAAGQCARAWLPEVREPLELDALLAAPPDGLRLLADGDGAPFAGAGREPATLLVGPEGGFEPAERDAAVAAGFTPLRLGPHVLRTETAAVVGAAVLIAGGAC